MAGNRQAATAFILANLEALLPGNSDTARYKTFLEGMTAKAFEDYMLDLKSGKRYVTLTAPNFGKSNLSIERNFALAKKLNVEFFHKLWIEGDSETPTMLTPIKYLVLKLPFRLASQRLAKKMSIPKTQRVINTLTGQPTGESKGASISYPELRVCAAMGLENSMVELMKYRGGDARGGAALNASILRTGRTSLKTLSYFASGVESTNTIRTFLACAHLKSTL
jgi:hypothetical protein